MDWAGWLDVLNSFRVGLVWTFRPTIDGLSVSEKGIIRLRQKQGGVDDFQDSLFLLGTGQLRHGMAGRGRHRCGRCARSVSKTIGERRCACALLGLHGSVEIDRRADCRVAVVFYEPP
jgi:hypothetical protein